MGLEGAATRRVHGRHAKVAAPRATGPAKALAGSRNTMRQGGGAEKWRGAVVAVV